MKYVINNDWGGFCLPEEICNKLGRNEFDDSGEVRMNQELIDWVLAHEDETDLAVVDIPEEATDWRLNEYDGWESIIAVIDGKLVDLEPIDEED